jgi:hypothetical protein
MSDAQLSALEREVQAARGRVSSDLARLRSPAVLSEFKQEVWREARGTKDELLGQAKDSVQNAAQGVFTDIKRRAAANPAAALAIGAGVMWHLVRKPPISSLLIGVGVLSLMKTQPSETGDFAEGVSAQAHDLATAVKDKAEEWSAAAADAAQRTAAVLGEEAGSLTDKTGRILTNANEAIKSRWAAVAPGATDLVPSQEARDQFLLGAAALAVAAAVGLSIQKRAEDRFQ